MEFAASSRTLHYSKATPLGGALHPLGIWLTYETVPDADGRPLLL